MADVNILIDVSAKQATKQLNKIEKDFSKLGADVEKAGSKLEGFTNKAAEAAKQAEDLRKQSQQTSKQAAKLGEKAEAAGQKAELLSNELKTATDETKQLNKAAQAAAKNAEKLAKQADKASTSTDELGNEVKITTSETIKLNNAAKQAAQEAERLGAKAKKSSDRVDSLGKEFKEASAEAKRLNKAARDTSNAASRLSRQADIASKKTDKFGKEAKEAAKRLEDLKKQDKTFSLISKSANIAAVAVAAIGTAVVGAISQASKLQDLETQFIAFTGSAEGAADQVERIAEFSGRTPFRIEELVSANRTLLAFGQTTEESLVTLEQLGEVASGTGANMGELALIFGQVQAAGRLTGERFLQFAERGINLAPILAKQLGVAESEIEKLRSAGKISADDVAKAFETMTSNGGIFEGSMKRLSKTFTGATSTLSDNIGLLAADLGKELLPAATAITVELTKGIQTFRAWFNETKPEQLRKLNNELKDTKEELESLNNGLALRGFFGQLGFSLEDNTEKAEALKKEIKALEEEIVNVATSKPIKAIEDQRQKEEQATPEDIERVESARKIASELEAIANEQVANERLRASEKNALIAEQLDAEKEIILQKQAEKQIALLESQGFFEEAQLAQAQENLRRIEAAEQQASEERIKQRDKENKKLLSLDQINQKAKEKFDEQSYQQRIATAQAGLGALISLQSTNSKQAFEIGKAAAIAQALVSIPSTAIKAYESLAGIPVVGPGLGAAAAAAAVVAGTARVNQIRSQKFTAFAEGGIVPGVGNTDSVPSLLTPGEVVVPETKFKDLNFNNDSQIVILNQIKSLMQTVAENTQVNIESDDAGGTPAQNINVELQLNGDVLANQILELNRDNQRLS